MAPRVGRIVSVLLSIHSCNLLVGTDVHLVIRPLQRGAPPLVCACGKLVPCSDQVARLRGGNDAVAGRGAESQSPTPTAKSWADLVRQPPRARTPSINRARTPSVNVEAIASPLPAGLEAVPEGAERIPIEMLADMDLNAGDGGMNVGDQDNVINILPFMTDSQIVEHAMKQQGPGTNAGKDRELEPFVCDDEMYEGRLEDDAEAQLDATSKRVKGFDQFKVNEEKFGIKTEKFNEDEYTAPINTSHPAYEEQLERAEKLAAEIEGSWNADGPTTMSNMHVRDDRNLPLPHDLDEATMYSTVNPRPMYSSVNPHRPSDPVAGQLEEDTPSHTLHGINAEGQEGGGYRVREARAQEEEEEEMEEMESKELEEVLEGAYQRYVQIIENGEEFPPQFQEILSKIQVCIYPYTSTHMHACACVHARMLVHKEA